MAILVDTGPLVALADIKDQDHDAVKKYMSRHRDAWVVPYPVVTETSIVLQEWLGPEAELGFLRSLAAKQMLVENVTNTDLDRIIEILEQYRDADFGMVDAAIMAIAERLKIDVILTLDHRDFSIYRPRHCPAFRLVP
jgi:predicted nucleic acid-binding protein